MCLVGSARLQSSSVTAKAQRWLMWHPDILSARLAYISGRWYIDSHFASSQLALPLRCTSDGHVLMGDKKWDWVCVIIVAAEQL